MNRNNPFGLGLSKPPTEPFDGAQDRPVEGGARTATSPSTRGLRRAQSPAQGERRRANGANALLLRPATKPFVFVLALLPFAWLLYGAIADTLGANPAEALIRSTGDWALRFLILTLAITPLRQMTGWSALARLRRMLGLFAFFYAVLHFVSYGWLDQGFDFAAIAKDIAKRPFILVGALQLALLVPLAATSFNRAIRALGAARWQALHRAVYAIAALAILHFFWMRAGKNDFAEWSVYAGIVAFLLGWRAVRALRSAPQRQRREAFEPRVADPAR